MKIKKELEKHGSSLLIKQGKPIDVFTQVCSEYNISSVYFNNDYEPYAIKRDSAISEYLKSKAIEVKFL